MWIHGEAKYQSKTAKKKTFLLSKPVSKLLNKREFWHENERKEEEK